MALGFDSGTRLDQHVREWDAFWDAWGKLPTYAGRYFSKRWQGIAWRPGELLGSTSMITGSVRYIAPFASANPIRIPPPKNRFNVSFGGHILPTGTAEGYENDFVQLNHQGESAAGRALRPQLARAKGREDALDTGRAIEAALNYVHPVTGKPELVLPESGAVFVFMDLEPQSVLSQFYWLGWSETISSYTLSRQTAVGTIDLVQPLRPSLYCCCDDTGPWGESVAAAFQANAFVDQWVRGKHPCHALATPNPFDAFPSGLNGTTDAMAATEADVQALWGPFGTLDQHIGVSAPVVLWQYRINIGVAANKKITTTEAGDSVLQYAIDISITSDTLYGGRPITDFMLQRPWP
jgi:hypothetical protein